MDFVNLPQRCLVVVQDCHLGAHVIQSLVRRGHKVRALLARGAGCEGLLQAGIEVWFSTGPLAAELCAAASRQESILYVGTSWMVADGAKRQEMDAELVLLPLLKVAAQRSVRVVLAYASSPSDASERADEAERLACRVSGHWGVPLAVLRSAPLLGPLDFKLSGVTRLVLDVIEGKGAIDTERVSWADARDVADAVATAVEKRVWRERYELVAGEVDTTELYLALEALLGGLPSRASRPSTSWWSLSRRRVLSRSRATEPAQHRTGSHTAMRGHASADLQFFPRALSSSLTDTIRWLARAGALSCNTLARLESRRASQLLRVSG